MAPGGIAADQHDEIRLVDVVVTARHNVLAKCADLSCHGRGHAQPGVGVDVRGADEPLHQLVGDVIVLGQKLAGDVKRHRIGTVLRDRARKSASNQVECVVPCHSAAVDLRV